MQYVYRYLDGQRTVYVGITNNMKRRFSQHKTDKLGNIHDCKVEFFSVNNRADAELLETYLINKFKTGNFYNVAKANRGDVSFLDGVEFPWTEYADGAKPTLFNVQSPVTVVEEKVVYKNRTDSLTQTIDRIHENMIMESAALRYIRETSIPECKTLFDGAVYALEQLPINFKRDVPDSAYNTEERNVLYEKCENRLSKVVDMWRNRIELLCKLADELEIRYVIGLEESGVKNPIAQAHKISYLSSLIEQQAIEINKFHREEFGCDYDVIASVTEKQLLGKE